VKNLLLTTAIAVGVLSSSAARADSIQDEWSLLVSAGNGVMVPWAEGSSYPGAFGTVSACGTTQMPQSPLNGSIITPQLSGTQVQNISAGTSTFDIGVTFTYYDGYMDPMGVVNVYTCDTNPSPLTAGQTGNLSWLYAGTYYSLIIDYSAPAGWQYVEISLQLNRLSKYYGL